MMTVRKATFTSAIPGALLNINVDICTHNYSTVLPLHTNKNPEVMPVFTDVVIFPSSIEKVVLPHREQKEDRKATKNMIK